MSRSSTTALALAALRRISFITEQKSVKFSVLAVFAFGNVTFSRSRAQTSASSSSSDSEESLCDLMLRKRDRLSQCINIRRCFSFSSAYWAAFKLYLALTRYYLFAESCRSTDFFCLIFFFLAQEIFENFLFMGGLNFRSLLRGLLTELSCLGETGRIVGCVLTSIFKNLFFELLRDYLYCSSSSFNSSTMFMSWACSKVRSIRAFFSSARFFLASARVPYLRYRATSILVTMSDSAELPSSQLPPRGGSLPSECESLISIDSVRSSSELFSFPAAESPSRPPTVIFQFISFLLLILNGLTKK